MTPLNARNSRTTTVLALLAPVALLGACAMTGPSGSTAPVFSQAGMPAAVQVPDGHKVALETVGVGKITYECRAKKDMAGQFEWVFVGPDAALNDRRGTMVATRWM